MARFKKVLLVSPSYYNSVYGSGATPDPGLGYIAEFLEENGIEYSVMDMGLGYSFDDLKKKIEEISPDLIGFGFKSFSFKNIYDLISDVKKEFPEIKIVAGGAHISVFREDVFNDCKAIDYGVVKEGEYTILDLVNGKPLSEIKGLYYRKDGKLIFTGEPERVTDLDKIPFPKYRKFELDKYWYSARYIITSRGCPYQCIFCSIKLVVGRQWFAASPEKVMGELLYWYDKGYRKFDFIDDEFTLSRERVMKLFDLIEKSKMKALSLNCTNSIRADTADKELFKRMKEVGFNVVGIGTEVSNDRLLRYIKKGEDMATIERAIKEACEAGFNVNVPFIIGFSGQTRHDIESAFKLALKYPIRHAFFYNLIPYKGTELYDMAKRDGQLIDPDCNFLNYTNTAIHNPMLNTKELSREEKLELLKKGREISAEVNRRYYIRRMKTFGKKGELAAFLYEKHVLPQFVLDVGLKLKDFANTKILRKKFI